MKKLTALIFGIIIAVPAICQTQQLAEVLRIWKRVDIPVQDGTIYKFRVYQGSDSARYFNPGLDTLEATITFKKKTVIQLPDIISTLDDNVISEVQKYNPATNLGDNVFTPTVAWAHMKNQTWNANHHAQTISVVEAPSASVEVSCTCYKIEWFAEKRNNHGIVSIQVDSGTPFDVDTYDPRTDNNSLKIYTFTATANGSHKVKISFTGRKNSQATSTNITHDKFVIYTKQ